MSEEKISPVSVTKPIQLLAAWLVGLLSLNASFLSAAAIIKDPSWAAGFLVICSALNVPLFLFCLFMLQTKFRPEMQEDQFYSKYLEKRYSPETGQTEIVEISVSDRSISNSLPKFPILRNVIIRINDLLPVYGDLVRDIISAGYKIDGTFGSTNKTPRPVAMFLLSVSPDVDDDNFREIVSLAAKNGLQAISLVIESDKNNVIYLGSYGYIGGSARVKFDEDLAQRIQSGEITPKNIQDFIMAAN